jgi:peptide/nickel transport system permease protein
MTPRRRRTDPDGSVVFELSRRKLPVPPSGTTFYALAVMLRSRLARTGALVLSLLVFIALFADLLASDLPVACVLQGKVVLLPNVTREIQSAEGASLRIDPLVLYGPLQVTQDVLVPPTTRHPLGTDMLGRDVFARVVHGTRSVLLVGLAAALAFVALGVVLGALAGFFGGVIDTAVARLVETLSAFPTLVIALVVQTIVARPSVTTLLLAITLTRWTEVARIVRAEVLLASEQDYVTSARALGAGPWRVLVRHVLPNAVAPAFVAVTFGIASVVLVEATLDFLGIGVPTAVPSWGEALGEAREHADAWWLFLGPGLMMFLCVGSFNIVGEALRDALDPRLRESVRIDPSGLDALSSRASMIPPSSASFDPSSHA